MPTFVTPGPISVAVELGVGDIQIMASHRADTIAEVRPTDGAKRSDAAAAARTRVEYAGGILTIKAPRGWRQYSFRGGGDSVDVLVELPAGSSVRGEAGVAGFRCTGRLGDCRYNTGVGDIRVEQAGPVQLKTGAGDLTVHRATGRAELATGTGDVQVGTVDGTAVIRNSNGDISIGEISGDLQANAANGRISVDKAHGPVAAKTANGDVRLGEVASGVVVAETGCGRLDVGVRDGVAAWLDLDTHWGQVHNGLDDAGPPGPGDDAVEVRARTGYGDITVRRSVADEWAEDNR
jgi:hypothetical protein